jgi:hypothetical protein
MTLHPVTLALASLALVVVAQVVESGPIHWVLLSASILLVVAAFTDASDDDDDAWRNP